jgi:hypothetical protein
MQLSPRKIAKHLLEVTMASLDLEVRRRGHDFSDTRNFIPFLSTFQAAERVGLSIGDYIDGIMNKTPGATQTTIDGMKALGVFAHPVETVVEIGPGSGRYLEKTIAECTPKRYEVYETSKAWADYIASKYRVVVRPTDGKTLSSTADDSVDLVQAHKVFCSIPSLPTWIYWTEMRRVCRMGGHVVFDLLTESCLDLSTLQRWVDSGIENGAYPAVMPRSLALYYFASCGFDIAGTFRVPMGVDRTTEVFVFRKH